MPWLPLLLTLSTAVGDASRSASPQSAQDVVQVEDVEVWGRRGAAQVAPQIELGAEEIDALGAYDIGEVVRRASEDYGLGDAPVVIVNGRRMADPGVFNRFPPDALARVEVLPPQAGALYGATEPGRRVVNIVLQRQFHSRDGAASLRRPTAGGMTNAAADLRQSSIAGENTRQLGLRLTRDTALRAGERNQERTSGAGGEAVTLRPAAESAAVNMTLTRSLGDWAASLNGNALAQERRSTSVRAREIIDSRRRSQNLNLRGGLNGSAAGWSVQLGLNGQLTETDQSGLSPSDSSQQTLAANLTTNRPLFDLPAGPVIVNLSGRMSASRSVTDAQDGRTTFSGHTSDFGGVLSVPLTRRRPAEEGFSILGDASLSLGASLSETGSGRGESLNAGLAWKPLPKLSFNGTWATSAQNLSDQQRFEPMYYGTPIMVFDFLTGESVEVLPILGGNPDLRAPSLDQVSLSATVGPFTAWNLQGGLSFQRNEALDGISSLPVPTPEVEAAFPDRFQRDADGRLISIDQRPINYASTLGETVSANLSAAFPLGRRDAGGRPGVVRLTLNHSRQIASTSIIHAGLPEMDRLAGDGGGLPRSQSALTIDARRGRWGVNAAARWRDGYRVRRDTGRDGPDDLKVGGFGTVDMKFSYQFERNLPGQGGRTRRGVGLQMELEVSNLFDARQSARLGDGRPAPGYGRDDQDPVGRTFLVSLKRRF